MDTQTTTSLPVGAAPKPDATSQIFLEVTKLPTMAELEQQYLNLVLAQTGGNKVKTAKILGFSVKTIYNKLDGYKADEALRDSTQGS